MTIKIKLIKNVIFKDWNGAVLNTYEVGTVFETTFEFPHYYVTAVGGIYKDEAEIYIET